MSRGLPTSALSAGAPLAVRAHLAVRAATCPIDAVVAATGSGPQVLEVGCGFGLVAARLALAVPGREVTGIDIDPRKVAAAQVVAANVVGLGGRLTVVEASALEVPPGPWHAIVAVDVLYLLTLAEQALAVRRWSDALAPGGQLVVKEMAAAPRWKAAWNRTQEMLAVRALRLTRGQAINPPSEDALAGWMVAAGLDHSDTSLAAGYPHPHHLHVGRKR